MAEQHKKDEGTHGGGGGHGGHASPGGHDEEEHGGAPEWLISFADNVALMMGFFVILLAITMTKAAAKSSGEEGGEGSSGAGNISAEMLDFAISVRKAFNNPVDVYNPLPNPRDLPLIRRVLEKANQGYSQNEGFLGKEHDVQSPQRGREPPEPAGVVGFVFKSSELTDAEATEQRLRIVAEHFQGVRLILEIRGHVSAEEVSHLPDRGMSLAFKRSLAVGQILAKHGLQWNQMRLLACGDNERRRKTAYGREANTLNERVEIVPTDEALPP